MSESEVVHLLARMFPSFRGVPPEEATRRGEALGLFAARAWAAGADGLAGRGIPVPPDVYQKLAGVAGQAAQEGRGGVAFLGHLRQGLADDSRYVQVMTGLARVFAEAARGGAAAATSARPAVQPPAGNAGLDLLPEQPSAPRSVPGELDLAPEPPRAAPARAPVVDELDLAPEADSGSRHSATELLYGQDEGGGVEQEAGGPEDPVEKAFWRYQRSGEPRFLDDAEKALRVELQSAPHAVAAALFEANLGKVALKRGDAGGASRLANSALARDPSNPYAVEVLVRVGRGEAGEAAFLQGLRQLSSALARRDVGRIQSVGQAMNQRYPVEPFGYLALLLTAHMADDAKAFERYLKQAWTCYPSPDHAHLTFGGDVDADLVDVLNNYGRRPYKKMDEAGLRQTVEDVDSKDNLIAGSLRMGTGLARVALAAPGITRSLQRRLHFSVGRGMMGLQYFQAAPDAMGKALMISPTAEEAKAISDERLKCQALWRAFDKPGIKAQGQAFKCLGAHGMAETLRRRLELIRKDREERQQGLSDKVPMLLERADADPAIAKELAQAATACSASDPLDAIRTIDRELADIEQGRSASAPKKSKGLFGKLKAAAVEAAKGVSDRIRIPQLTARRKDAVKNLAVVVARDLCDHTFKNPILVGFARQAAILEAFVDYLQAEESRCKKELAQLASS